MALISKPNEYLRVGIFELEGLMNLLDRKVEQGGEEAPYYSGAYLFATMLRTQSFIDTPDLFMRIFGNLLEVRHD